MRGSTPGQQACKAECIKCAWPGVDTSKPALDLARRNAELNGVEDRCIFLNEDIMQVMKDQFAKGLRFDIVILDPPKLAPTRNSLTAATRRCETPPLPPDLFQVTCMHSDRVAWVVSWALVR